MTYSDLFSGTNFLIDMINKKVPPLESRLHIHESNQSQVEIFERKIVSVLNIHKLFFLSPNPEQYRVATICVVFVLYYK